MDLRLQSLGTGRERGKLRNPLLNEGHALLEAGLQDSEVDDVGLEHRFLESQALFDDVGLRLDDLPVLAGLAVQDPDVPGDRESPWVAPECGQVPAAGQ